MRKVIEVGNTTFAGFVLQNNSMINGNTYNNVYVMQVDTATISTNIAWRFYYTKENGLLRSDLKERGNWEWVN